MWSRSNLGLALAVVVAAGPACSVALASEDAGIREGGIAAADEAYAERGREVNEQRRTSPEPIASAIRILEGLYEQSPDDIDVQWRLIRALYFSGDHSSEPEERREERLDRARDVGAASMEQLAQEYGGGDLLEDLSPDEIRERVPEARRTDVAAVYYWTAVAWGSWSQLTGILSAITDGVANELYDYSKVVIALDPGYDLGGAHRLRSYLHATVPSIPFVSGWVDPDLAVPEAEAAMAIDEAYRGNQVIYGVALLETRDAERAKATEILQRVAKLEPRAEPRAEDVSIQALAIEKLSPDP